MQKSSKNDDISALLYLVPFVASGAYGLYLWAEAGISAVLPSNVYLEVTRDPYVFLAGFLAILLSTVLELGGTDAVSRPQKVGSLSSRLQKLAAATFVLAFLFAFYANSFDLNGTALDFVYGRYALLFPAFLVLLSYLMTIPLERTSLKSMKLVGIVVMFVAVGVIYEVGKRAADLGLGGGLLLLAVGVLLVLRKSPAKTE